MAAGGRARYSGWPAGVRTAPGTLGMRWWGPSTVLAALAFAGAAPAQEKLSAEPLAKLAQNSIADLDSVPFQNNANFNYASDTGRYDAPMTSRPHAAESVR